MQIGIPKLIHRGGILLKNGSEEMHLWRDNHKNMTKNFGRCYKLLGLKDIKIYHSFIQLFKVVNVWCKYDYNTNYDIIIPRA